MIPVHQLNTYLGLKWNPFQQEIPTSSLYIDDTITQFCWRVEHLILDGGYALITGEPGSGKSAVLRHLQSHLSNLPEISVKTLSRPQSRLRDFYRELGSLFGVDIQPSNRYGGFQRLRDQWLAQIQTSMFRPVLLIDESQEVPEEVLSEIRILGSSDLDARCILAAVFAGDKRILKNLQSAALLPLESRIRTRLHLDSKTPEHMKTILEKALSEAGNKELMTPGVMKALAEQSLGNPRAMMIAGNELLTQAVYRGLQKIDENLYFEVFRVTQKKKRSM